MQNEASGNIARVAVKAPPFWRANPELWFKQIESQFILAGWGQLNYEIFPILCRFETGKIGGLGDFERSPAKDPQALEKICVVTSSEEKKLKDVISGDAVWGIKTFPIADRNEE
ncbi:hypothetical protein HNY73_002359 [Argiope bruennichi]|uniref:Uncharacterized protein n=1 Tax=Argiope bruennichi TaxID=94029 RepID=A0A8T0FTE4_ARGBR|nr:hypothetical protein HNY73_002359 [Argiope bruennichi]